MRIGAIFAKAIGILDDIAAGATPDPAERHDAWATPNVRRTARMWVRIVVTVSTCSTASSLSGGRPGEGSKDLMFTRRQRYPIDVGHDRPAGRRGLDCVPSEQDRRDNVPRTSKRPRRPALDYGTLDYRTPAHDLNQLLVASQQVPSNHTVASTG